MGAHANLNLPEAEKMTKYLFCYDIDGTLRDNTITDRVVANERIRTHLIITSSFKNCKVLVWSGGGAVYAHQMVEALAISKYVSIIAGKDEYEEYAAKYNTIAIDDIHSIALGNTANLVVNEK